MHHTHVADPLLPDDRGRRHLTMAGSKTEAFRPCRRVLTPGFSGAKHARAQGLARIEPSPRVTPRPTGLRTNAEASRRSGYDIPDPGLVVRSKRSPHTTHGLQSPCQVLFLVHQTTLSGAGATLIVIFIARKSPRNQDDSVGTSCGSHHRQTCCAWMSSGH